MATIKYLIQSKSSSAPIYCRLSLGRGAEEGKYISIKRKTGLTVDPKNWSYTNGCAKERDEALRKLNSQLRKLQSYILDNLNTDHQGNTEISGEWLDHTIKKHFGHIDPERLEYFSTFVSKFITEDLPYKVAERSNNTIGTATLKKYKNALHKITAFEEKTGKRYLTKNVNLDFKRDFTKYLLKDEGLAKNTVGRLLRFVKTFVLEAQRQGYKINPQSRDIVGFTVKVPKITLSFEELETIRNTEYSDETLEAAKDWLVIGCYVGQRVSDLLRMNSKMITTINNMGFIHINQVKTGKPVNIPIHPIVQEILSKRNGEFPPSFNSRMDSNTTLFNRYLKRVCQIAQINEICEGSLRDKATNKKKSGAYEKWQLISSHTCRRSFATNFYGKPAYPTPLLMNITAHSTEKQFLEYCGKDRIDYSLQLAEIWAAEAAKVKQQPKLEVVKDVVNN